MVAAQMNLRASYVAYYWTRFGTADYDIFKSITLAKDGGLRDITAAKLLYPMQYFYAALSVLFIVMNTGFIFSQDMACVYGGYCGKPPPEVAEAMCIQRGMNQSCNATCVASVAEGCHSNPSNEQSFLLTRALLFSNLPAERIIAILEFLALVVLLLRMIRYTLQALSASSKVFRWVCVVQLFWQTIPMISCFSLMRLLYYVTPSVIGTEAYYVITMTRERIEHEGRNFKAIWPAVRYVVFRIVFAIIGFDAFLMKLRLVGSGVVAANPSFVQILHFVLFLFQVLGVVSLTWFVRERLFLFIFGSENGDMTNEQKARMIVWNAMIAQKIHEEFGLFKFLIIMLGFDDYDFQVLVMDETGEVDGENSYKRMPSADDGLQEETPLGSWEAWLLGMATDF